MKKTETRFFREFRNSETDLIQTAMLHTKVKNVSVIDGKTVLEDHHVSLTAQYTHLK